MEELKWGPWKDQADLAEMSEVACVVSQGLVVPADALVV